MFIFFAQEYGHFGVMKNNGEVLNPFQNKIFEILFGGKAFWIFFIFLFQFINNYINS